MKVAFIVDSLPSMGGVPRILVLMAKTFKADLFVGRYYPDKTFQEFKSLPIEVLVKKRFPHRVGSLIVKNKMQNLRLKGYDLYILFGGYSLYAAANHRPSIWWSIGPRKWLYDTYELEKKQLSIFKRQIFRVFSYFLRKQDQNNVRAVDNILAISNNVQRRLYSTYGKNSTIIFPGAKISNLKYKRTGDYYLSTARLSRDKRVDAIVKAFNQMPEKKLVVISSGPDYQKIKSLAQNNPNIKVTGLVSDKELVNYYGNCLATIFASYKEDFGLVAVESMAAGKPVIASGDMGFSETVIQNKTGLLINPSVTNIIKAVKKLTPQKAKSMRQACETRAKEFSEEKFIRELKDYINQSAKSYQKSKK